MVEPEPKIPSNFHTLFSLLREQAQLSKQALNSSVLPAHTFIYYLCTNESKTNRSFAPVWSKLSTF